MVYAAHTEVAVEKTRAEIEKLVVRAGADAYVAGIDGKQGSVMFRMQGRYFRFSIGIPDTAQAQRTRWRALLLVIKAKLEAVESGIQSLEDEFLANTVMSDGQTVGDFIRPQVEENYRIGGVPKLALSGPRP